MARVTATALQKQFGKWADHAMREPVAIEKHGREVLYLISAEEFRRLDIFGEMASRADNLKRKKKARSATRD